MLDATRGEVEDFKRLRETAKVTRTVVVPGVVLTKRKHEVFRSMRRCTGHDDGACGVRFKSSTEPKRHMYRKLLDRHPQIPSHYVHTAKTSLHVSRAS